MSITVVEFQRRFLIWAYSVSHRQLLLRSKSSDSPSRVDVLFKGVAAMELPSMFDGFSLVEISREEASDLNIRVGANSMTGQKIFAIQGANFRGYIVAMAVFWHEDQGSYSDESYFKNEFALSDAELLSSILGRSKFPLEKDQHKQSPTAEDGNRVISALILGTVLVLSAAGTFAALVYLTRDWGFFVLVFVGVYAIGGIRFMPWKTPLSKAFSTGVFIAILGWIVLFYLDIRQGPPFAR